MLQRAVLQLSPSPRNFRLSRSKHMQVLPGSGVVCGCQPTSHRASRGICLQRDLALHSPAHHQLPPAACIRRQKGLPPLPPPGTKHPTEMISHAYPIRLIIFLLSHSSAVSVVQHLALHGDEPNFLRWRGYLQIHCNFLMPAIVYGRVDDSQ
jgi:hypothetical protein